MPHFSVANFCPTHTTLGQAFKRGLIWVCDPFAQGASAVESPGVLDGYANALQKNIDALRMQKLGRSAGAGFSVRELEAWKLKKEVVQKGKVQRDRDSFHDPQAWGPPVARAW